MKTQQKRVMVVLAVMAMLSMACSLGGATDLAQSAAQTAEAFAKSSGGDLEQTLQAIAPTLQGVEVGSAPSDIPVPDERDNFFGSDSEVLYLTKLGYQDVVDYYQAQMPANGWTDATGTIILEKTASLIYTKDNRKATIIITVIGESTGVQIAIENK